MATKLQFASKNLMSDYALPLSISITHEQLAWLDARRRHGSLSRSAALRQVLDGVIRDEALTAASDRGSTSNEVAAYLGW